MRHMLFLAGMLCLLALSGCCPSKPWWPGEKEAEVKPTPPPTQPVKPAPVVKTPLLPPESPKPARPSEPVPPDKGTATSQEIAKVARGESLPVQPVPPERTFVRPDTISPEMAELFQNIYFDYDKYDITPDAETRLKRIAAFLLRNPKVMVMIEGHCDERGTREYNLVLGEQRALSARDYLVLAGVAPARLFPISFGEDRPADPRSNEEAWAKNRRGEFKISLE